MKFSIAIATLFLSAVTAIPIFVDCETAADKASADATGLRCRNPVGQTNGNTNGNGGTRNGAGSNRDGAANSRNGNNNNNDNTGGNNSIFVDCQTAADKASADATGLRCRKNPE